MIRNYFTIAFRNFLRNKNYTLINILGLSIGITSCIILFLLITYDTGFDKFHHHYDRIYRVVRDVKSASGIQNEAITPYPFAGAFRQDFSDIPLITQFHFHSEGFLSIGTEKQQVEEVIFADSMFFKVFDFGVVSGNPSKDLGEPNKAFLTESLASKLNLREGDKLKLDNKIDLEIVGLVKDVPANSHIRYNMIVSMPSFTKEFFGWPVDRWGLSSAGFSYIILPENISEEQVTDRFKAFVKKYYDEEEEAERNTYLLQPLREIHFDTRFSATPGHVTNIDVANLFILGVLGLFILIIACINFVNLATALAVKKSKEIGIRKTLGAKRIQLTAYFLSETFLLTLIAVIISLGLVEWSLPWLRGFVEKEMHLNLLTNPLLVIFLFMLVIVATLFSGFYPAVILSGFDPVAVLKNKINAQGSSGSFVRRTLVIFQFVIAQVMIIGTLIVTDQMSYFNSKPLGFKAEAVVNVPLPENDKLLDNFRSRLEANPNIKNISFAVGAPTSESNIGTGFWLEEKGPSENYGVGIKTVDYDYKDTYGIQLKAGRWFYEGEEKKAVDTTLKNDERYVFIINEAAARKLGFNSAEEVLEKRIHIGLDDISAPVVGVTEDFHTSSLRQKIDPVIMIIFPSLYYDAGISINTTDISGTIEFIKKTWEGLFPEYYFEYEFLDQHLANLYRAEQRQLTLFRIFSGISIFIGCLGLLGLVSFMANQKIKEIGVRKVFGASVTSILMMFSKEFVQLVIIAFLLAAPLSWYLMSRWLENFEYHDDIHWSVFVVGFVVTIAIALMTVSYRSIRAGLTNPVDSLRAE